MGGKFTSDVFEQVMVVVVDEWAEGMVLRQHFCEPWMASTLQGHTSWGLMSTTTWWLPSAVLRISCTGFRRVKQKQLTSMGMWKKWH